jgi:CheY-like chemotaxis protein
MSMLLSAWGCQVITALGLAQAEERLAATKATPSAILSDYRLPGEATGIDVIRTLRLRAGFAVPGVLLTGDTAPARLLEAEYSGFHLLHKPVNPNQLRALLSQLVAGTGNA